jgi:hypothetical protein
LFNPYPQLRKRVYFAGGGKDLATLLLLQACKRGVEVGRRKRTTEAAGDA